MKMRNRKRRPARGADPVSDARREHKAHRGSGAIWDDCVECNPLADEHAFLKAVQKPLNAAVTGRLRGEHGDLR